MFSGVFRISALIAVALIALLAAPLAAADLQRDPTRPPSQSLPAAVVSPVGSWKVSSILVSSERRVATINGRTVQEGELIDGARVVRIEPTTVRLRSGQQELSIHLSNRRIKKPTAYVGGEVGEK